MPRAHDRMPRAQETSVTVTMQEPGKEPVEVDLEKGYTPSAEDTDTKSKEKPDAR